MNSLPMLDLKGTIHRSHLTQLADHIPSIASPADEPHQQSRPRTITPAK
jgi:hypothetical protein